jgi:hypothetical protein
MLWADAMATPASNAAVLSNSFFLMQNVPLSLIDGPGRRPSGALTPTGEMVVSSDTRSIWYDAS